MEAEATKVAPKLRLPQGAKLGVKVGKRGQSTKIQRKRKLKKLEKALSHIEKVSERGTQAQMKSQRRQTAKSLWNNNKANQNMFSVLAP